MLGNIGFNGYRVRCIIGIKPHERTMVQDLLIHLKVEVDFAHVSLSGRLEDTIDYLSLAAVCKDLAEKGKYFLIEKYAVDVIEELFTLFPIKSVWIHVMKPGAISEAEYAFVELYSSRNQDCDFDRAKAPGLADRKSVHISNIDRLAIDQPRELWHGSKSNPDPGWSIKRERQ